MNRKFFFMKILFFIGFLFILLSGCSQLFPKRIVKIKNKPESFVKINQYCDSFGINQTWRFSTKIVKSSGLRNDLQNGIYNLTTNGKCRDCGAEAYVLTSGKELIVLSGLDSSLFAGTVTPFMYRNGYSHRKIKKAARFVFGMKGWKKVIHE